MKNKRIYIWLPLIIAASIAVGILLGNVISQRTNAVSMWSKNNNKLESILDFINRSYVDEIETNQLIEKAIPSVIAELDPHSAYITAEDMALTGEELDGHFSGIGVEFMIQNDSVTIVNVIYGGPSEAAGLMAGDRLVTVNDTLFVGKDLSNEKVFKKLRGAKNTLVQLGVKRSSSPELLDFTITRADVPIKSVDAAYMMTNEIGYIKVSKFGGNTHSEFITAIAKLKSEGSKSFIIDLQQNTGGYLGAAVMMTNEFLSGNDLIVYTEGRTYPRDNIYADNSGTCKNDQLVVLVDENSASASEIFAGAIQDNDRGLIVGRRSFGKGLVQTQHKFKDGSAIRLTIARYHTPSGRCIQKSYEQGKGAEYSRDLINRYMRGEFDNRDSIKLDSLPLFKTKAGRPVYGDDGVLSDVFVPRDTIGLNSYYMKIVNSGMLREYAFEYTDKNRETIKKFATWQEAAKYLETQPLVNNLVNYAFQKGIRRRPILIEESRALLKNQLEALIIRNAFGDAGFYPIYLRDDTTIKKAVQLIEKNLATPEAIREEKYKELI